MTPSIDLSNLKIIQAMQTLAEFGLGVSVPHAHDEKGNFTALESGVISCEENSRVSFHTKENIPYDNPVAVGWRWNQDTQLVEITNSCSAKACDGMGPRKDH
jgi:hypothetical protein